MIDASAASDTKEAAAYIVEQTVIEGRSQGFAMTSADASQAGSRRATVFRGSLLDALVASHLGTASGPNHATAQSGDTDAATRLARKLVTGELLAVMRNQAPSDTIVVGVAAGMNALPSAAAHSIAAKPGLQVDERIVQATTCWAHRCRCCADRKAAQQNTHR